MLRMLRVLRMLSIVRYLVMGTWRAWWEVLNRRGIYGGAILMIVGSMVWVIPWWHAILILVSSCQIMLKVTTVWRKIRRSVSTKKRWQGKRGQLLLWDRMILRGR